MWFLIHFSSGFVKSTNRSRPELETTVFKNRSRSKTKKSIIMPATTTTKTSSSASQTLAIVGTSLALPQIRTREQLYDCIMDKLQMSMNIIEHNRAHPSQYDVMKTGNPWLFTNAYANFLEKEEVENFDADLFGLKSK